MFNWGKSKVTKVSIEHRQSQRENSVSLFYGVIEFENGDMFCTASFEYVASVFFELAKNINTWQVNYVFNPEHRVGVQLSLEETPAMEKTNV